MLGVLHEEERESMEEEVGKEKLVMGREVLKWRGSRQGGNNINGGKGGEWWYLIREGKVRARRGIKRGR